MRLMTYTRSETLTLMDKYGSSDGIHHTFHLHVILKEWFDRGGGCNLNFDVNMSKTSTRELFIQSDLSVVYKLQNN